MRTRHVGNNWVPLFCLSLVFLTAGAATMVAARGKGSSVATFEALLPVAAAVSALWLWRNPSWWIAPAKHYLYLLGALIAGVFLTGLIPLFNGCGPWILTGGALLAYGHLERLRLLVTTGTVVTVMGFLAMVVPVDIWGAAMHVLCAAVLAVVGNRLYVLRNGQRRQASDSDPGFIGSFEEFDDEEPPNFWDLTGRN